MAREKKLIFEGVVLHLLPQSNHDNYTEPAPEDTQIYFKKAHDRPDRNRERDREVYTCREKSSYHFFVVCKYFLCTENPDDLLY